MRGEIGQGVLNFLAEGVPIFVVGADGVVKQSAKAGKRGVVKAGDPDVVVAIGKNAVEDDAEFGGVGRSGDEFAGEAFADFRKEAGLARDAGFGKKGDGAGFADDGAERLGDGDFPLKVAVEDIEKAAEAAALEGGFGEGRFVGLSRAANPLDDIDEPIEAFVEGLIGRGG